MRTRNLVIAVLTAALGASATVLAQKPQKDVLYPATVVFSDRAGDAITSDGLGAYTNGGGVELGFHTSTNDLVMRGDSGSRYITFDSTRQVTTTGPESVANEFDVTINIRGILDMVRGESRQTNAHLSAFRFNPSKYSGTTPVDVFRGYDGLWTITAEGGDIAALTQVIKGKERVVGLYEMPFQITAACPTCS